MAEGKAIRDTALLEPDRADSPDDGHVVGPERGVGTDQRDALRLRLGDQHAVERIRLMPGQARGAQRVTLGDRQKLHVRGQVQVAREHLTKAQNEAAAGDLRDALQWGFASLEAAIDALAAARGMAIDEKHWKRTQAASSLHATGVLPTDLSDLHRSLNETRKAVFYDGEDLDPPEVSIEDVLSDVEGAVVAAEAEAT